MFFTEMLYLTADCSEKAQRQVVLHPSLHDNLWLYNVSDVVLPDRVKTIWLIIFICLVYSFKVHCKQILMFWAIELKTKSTIDTVRVLRLIFCRRDLLREVTNIFLVINCILWPYKFTRYALAILSRNHSAQTTEKILCWKTSLFTIVT